MFQKALNRSNSLTSTLILCTTHPRFPNRAHDCTVTEVRRVCLGTNFQMRAD